MPHGLRVIVGTVIVRDMMLGVQGNFGKDLFADRALQSWYRRAEFVVTNNAASTNLLTDECE
jgi:hypothetical protein